MLSLTMSKERLATQTHYTTEVHTISYFSDESPLAMRDLGTLTVEIKFGFKKPLLSACNGLWYRLLTNWHRGFPFAAASSCLLLFDIAFGTAHKRQN